MVLNIIDKNFKEDEENQRQIIIITFIYYF